MDNRSEKVLYLKESSIRWLTVNHPEKRNALSADVRVLALEKLRELERDKHARVLIVSGAGGTFVSGGDVAEFAEKRHNAEATSEYNKLMGQLYEAMQNVSIPTIAMIRGFCYGGGVALAACCDLRVCADDALFCIPASRLGIAYSPKYTRLLMNLVGPAVAKEMLYTARRYSAPEAAQMGLVNRVVQNRDLEKFVREYVISMAQNAPLSIKAAKFIVGDNLRDANERDPRGCATVVDICSNSEDYKEGRTAFIEKRQPVFTGR